MHLPGPKLSAADTQWFDSGDENVVLSPPRTAADAGPNIDAFAEADGEQGNPSGHRRSMPVGSVAATLIVGATVTLSAQTLMRRSVEIVPAAPSVPPVGGSTPLPRLTNPRRSRT